MNKHEVMEYDLDWVNDGIDVIGRRFSLVHDELTDEQICQVLRGIQECYRLDPEKEILLQISTTGGDAYASLSFHLEIKKLPGIKLHTIGLGKVMSCGLDIFLAGTIRQANDATGFLCHKASESSIASAKAEHLKVLGKEIKRLDDGGLEILADNTKKSKSWWKRKIKEGDFYFGIKEARQLGVIND